MKFNFNNQIETVTLDKTKIRLDTSNQTENDVQCNLAQNIKNRSFATPSKSNTLNIENDQSLIPQIIFESITPQIHHNIETPLRSNTASSKVNFPPHQRNPIPFSVETPTHDNSMMQDHTYPQIPNIPSDANNDLEILKTLRTKYQNNPAIGYLNINSLRGQKFSQLEQITQMNELDIFCIDETKLTSEIPTSKFSLPGYQYPPFRRDRISNSNSHGGGKLVYIKEGIICKRLDYYETKTAETICLELSLKSKKWFIMFGYRPESINRDLFFQEVNQTIDKAINKYENILFIGDLNIDLNIKNHDKKNFLEDMCDTFDLTNMVKQKTCFMSELGSSIDLILTNKPKSFYMTIPIETGLSDHHKMVVTFLRNHISLKLKPKNI